ncbi:MAG: hypothetical protein ACREOH_07525 [Candidatus Entotheonellia bacterium]
MKCSTVVVILGLVAALSVGSVAVVNAGEPVSGPVQQIEGRIKSIQIACDAPLGVCEGAMVLAERHRGDVTLAIRPGTWIRRGEQLLTPGELEVSVPIKAFAFQMSGEQLPRVALIEVNDLRAPLTPP